MITFKNWQPDPLLPPRSATLHSVILNLRRLKTRTVAGFLPRQHLVPRPLVLPHSDGSTFSIMSITTPSDSVASTTPTYPPLLS